MKHIFSIFVLGGTILVMSLSACSYKESRIEDSDLLVTAPDKYGVACYRVRGSTYQSISCVKVKEQP